MSKYGWSKRIVLKYTLLQLPALAALILILILIQGWIDIPPWITWSSIVFWVAKDIILFPFVWRAYDSEPKDKEDAMVGERGIAKERLNPSGYVLVRGELWKAEATEGDLPIEKGAPVRVQKVQGLTLSVQRDEKEE